MIPYTPETYSSTQDHLDMHLIIKGLDDIHHPGLSLTTPANRALIVTSLVAAGFAKKRPRKVSKLQLWSYGIETALLALATFNTSTHDHPFIYGALVALTFGSLTTFLGGFIINHQIKREERA